MDAVLASDPERPPEASLVVRAAGRHPHVVDAVVVLAVCFVALPPVFIHGRGGLSAVLLSAGLIAPLVVRRRFPLVAFGAIAGVALLQWFVGGPLVADVALLVCFASIAANRPARATLVAAAVLEAGVALAVTRWFNDTWLPSLVFLSGMVTAAGFMGTNLRTRRAYLAHLEDRARRLERERDQQIRLAEAGERARIARELHDVVAHHLTVVITLADAAGRLPDGAAGRGRELMATVSATGRTALTEMRRLLGVLREEPADGGDRVRPAGGPLPVGRSPAPERDVSPEPDPDPDVRSDRTPPSGLRAHPEVRVEPERRVPSPLSPQPDLDCLDDLLAQVRLAGVPVVLTVSGERPPLAPGVELALYRAMQEALTNVLRHGAPGSRATVRIGFDALRVRVRVVDEPSERPLPVRAATSSGHGLIGMRERIAACGGTVTAGPRADGGWEVRVEVPVARTAAATGPATGGQAAGGVTLVGARGPLGMDGPVR